MADAQIWGMLPKAQYDSTTIDEAVTAAIAAHNDDPDAHMAAGQSIDVHRANTVIDHPQGSVVGDKYTNHDFTITPDFSSVANGYFVSTGGIFYSLAGVRFETGGTSGTTKTLRASGQYSPAYYDGVHPTTFQFTAHMIDTTNYTAYGLAGTDGVLEVGPGLGFKFVNGTLYAVEIYVDAFGDPQEVTSTIAGVTVTDPHLYRCQLDAAGVATFFVDGNQVASWTVHSNTDAGLILFSFQIKNTAAVTKRAHFSGVYLSLSPI
jgi:hypothetical protein